MTKKAQVGETVTEVKTKIKAIIHINNEMDAVKLGKPLSEIKQEVAKILKTIPERIAIASSSADERTEAFTDGLREALTIRNIKIPRLESDKFKKTINDFVHNSIGDSLTIEQYRKYIDYTLEMFINWVKRGNTFTAITGFVFSDKILMMYLNQSTIDNIQIEDFNGGSAGVKTKVTNRDLFEDESFDDNDE